MKTRGSFGFYQAPRILVIKTSCSCVQRNLIQCSFLSVKEAFEDGVKAAMKGRNLIGAKYMQKSCGVSEASLQRTFSLSGLAYLAVSSNDADQMRMDGAWQLRDKTLAAQRQNGEREERERGERF